MAPKKVRICKMCGETFDHKSELRLHRRSVHGQEPGGNSIDLVSNMILLGDEKAGEWC